MFRTPPRINDDDAGGTVDNREGCGFIPPSQRLGAITKKGNEIKQLMNAQCRDKTILQSLFDEYLQRIQNLTKECIEQDLTEENEEKKRQEWLATNNSVFVDFQINFQKYIEELSNPSRSKQYVSQKSLSVASSVKSSTSSARIRLAENKAKIIAEKAYNEKIAALENKLVQQEQEHKRKLREAETERKLLENSVLEQELDKLDGIAEVLENEPGPSCSFLPNQRQSRRLPEKEKNENYDHDLLSVLQKQNEISLSIARHQHKAELPKRELCVFNGKDVTEYKPFISNFKRTIEDKCTLSADCLYYLLQYTTGTPHDLVKSWGNSDPVSAYRNALKLLDNEYGHEYKVAAAFLDKLENWPIIKNEDGEGLKRLSIYLRTCENNMPVMAMLNQLNSPKEIMSIVLKLPFELRKIWRRKALELEELGVPVTFSELVKFTEKQSDLLNLPLFGNIKDGQTKTSDLSIRRKVLSTKVNEPRSTEREKKSIDRIQCKYCKKDNHNITKCFFLRKLEYDKKLEFIKNAGLCFACLKEGHSAKGCQNRLECNQCKRKHPTILHNENFIKPREIKPPAQQDETTICGATVAFNNGGTGAGVTTKVLCSVLPVRIRVAGQVSSVVTYASLDTCSTSCFMNDNLLGELGIKAVDSNVNISTMSTKDSFVKTKIINNLEIFDMQDNLKDTIPVVYAQQNWPFAKEDSPVPSDMKEHLSNLPYSFINSTVGLIIGMNRPEMIKPLQIIDGPRDSVYASLHQLGWALNGPVGGKRERVIVNRVKVSDNTEINNMIKSMYEKDYSDTDIVSRQPSSDDEKWLSIMNESIKKVSGNYEVKLPIKPNTHLPSNKTQIYSIFQSLHKKLSVNKELFNEYNDFMKMMHDKGFMEKIPESDLNADAWYLMHHSVRHKQKHTLRVVFNCSLKYGGVSLNDVLYQGPDLTNNLLGVLMRFREENIAFTADIEKMFYQVKVSPEHRNYLRFFWWENFDLTQRPCEYRLTVHLFGATSSPAVANFALRRTATENSHYSEEAKAAVLRSFYVDDLLCSVEDEKEAVKLYNDVKALVSTGGFNLTKLTSNSPILTSEHCDETSKQIDKCLNLNCVLGLKWETQSDILRFNVNIDCNKPVTKRALLSVVHGIYDPLGLAAPTVVFAKKAFQESCRLKIGWDDELPDSIKSLWLDWLRELPQLEKFSIQRSCKPSVSKRVELHYFCDGSESAYGSIVYVRFVLENNSVHCAPLLSKSRLTPLNNTAYKTIPRIELNGAKLSIILKQIVSNEMNYQIDREYFWTDSTTVLQYLNSNDKRFTRFVSNRVSFILSNSQPTDWKYVSSNVNPADHISRGVSVSKFLSLDDWVNGPTFLWEHEDKWPKQVNLKNVSTTDLEISKTKLCLASLADTDLGTDKLLKSCSSFYKLKVKVAWLLRYKGLLMGNVVTGNLSINELNESEMYIIKYLQYKYFKETIERLKNNKCLSKKDSLIKLDPYLDNVGLLRVGGRLQNSDIGYKAKHPVVLPGKNFVVNLIISETHVLLGHMGRETLVAYLRRKYWIIGLNSVIRKLIFNCITCRKLNAQPTNTKMAALPGDRVQGDDPPFTCTGLDYFGPYEVTNGRKHEKRYGVIFTCLTSRAIHLEMAHSLSTDSFINCLRRFMARRGNVKLIRSDNGTNLKAGEKEINAAIRQWNLTTVNSWMAQRSIDWKFQPPAASHFGGVFEREIRTIRKVLTALLKEQPLRLNDEHLNTLLCEVEGILNNRPLTEQSSDPHDYNALTPNHLLLLDAGVTFPPGLFSKQDNYATRRWKQVQYLADLFWKRWRQSYIPLLQRRQKWHNKTYKYEVGDLVLLTDVLLPRSLWSLGRIIEVYPDKHGNVRVVKLRVPKCKNLNKDSLEITELVRPISKIVLLKSSSNL